MKKRVGVRHLFYQELQEGDFKKIRAESNVSRTGGGARDLRIRPQTEFESFVARLIPTTQERHTRRRGIFQVRFEKVFWNWEGRRETRDLEIWPPTDAREGELRIKNIDKSFPDAVPSEGGKVFVVIVRDDAGELWAHYLTERDLRTGTWHAEIADPILGCLDRTKKAKIRGYVDYVRGERYCHE